MKIKKNTIVTIDCSGRDVANDVVLISCADFTYIHGNYGELLPTIEDALRGKSVGDTLELSLTETAFGEFDEELVLVEDHATFEGDVEIGAEFELVGEEFFFLKPPHESITSSADFLLRDREANKDRLIYKVTDIDSGKVVLDGNHPFASTEVVFSISVKNVRQPSAEEIHDALLVSKMN